MALDADALIASARDETGLDDLDDDTLPDRLTDVVDQLNERAGDLAAAAAVVHDLLVQRLGLVDSRHADERIERPIIVFGEARSGTTLLQMLLGGDPESRLLEFWEVMRPCPPPDEAERRRRGDDDWREILDLVPRWLVSHPYNALLGANPPECERLWAFDFRSTPPSAWWRVPGIQFPPLRLPRDDARQYEVHRMVLQHLQRGRAARRWVLKGVTHQHRLAALLDAYPDAAFVWIHRDPLVSIASRIELQAQIYEAINGGIDRAAFAAATVAASVPRFEAAANDPLAADQRIHHVAYPEFTSDPVGTIRAIYEACGLTVTDAFETAMRAWLADNPSNRFGRFTYDLAAIGPDLDALDVRLQAYRERFGVERELPRAA